MAGLIPTHHHVRKTLPQLVLFLCACGNPDSQPGLGLLGNKAEGESQVQKTEDIRVEVSCETSCTAAARSTLAQSLHQAIDCAQRVLGPASMMATFGPVVRAQIVNHDSQWTPTRIYIDHRDVPFPSVAAHELGHGLYRHDDSSDLRDVSKLEEHAIAEGFADVFATTCAATNQSKWEIRGSKTLRRVDAPRCDGSFDFLPAFLKEPRIGFNAASYHAGGGIVRKAFYLLATGADNSSTTICSEPDPIRGRLEAARGQLGEEATLRLFFESLRSFDGRATFLGLRQRTSELLAGQRQIAEEALRKIWDHVGVPGGDVLGQFMDAGHEGSPVVGSRFFILVDGGDVHLGTELLTEDAAGNQTGAVRLLLARHRPPSMTDYDIELRVDGRLRHHFTERELLLGIVAGRSGTESRWRMTVP